MAGFLGAFQFWGKGKTTAGTPEIFTPILKRPGLSFAAFFAS